MRIIPVILLAAACASAPARPPPPEKHYPPLPRSSIAAVLEHAGELALTSEQITSLAAIDDRLEQSNAALRSEAAARRESSGTPPAENPGGGMGGRGGGRGRGGGGMGMGGGGRGGGSRPRLPDADAARGAIRQRLDDNDTKAFLEAEALFTPAQLPRAEEIASKYREQLFERREAHDHREE